MIKLIKFGKIGKKRRLREIPTRLIVLSQNRTRSFFAEDELIKLADSIKKYGVIEPLCVREISDAKGGTVYELIAGERRLRACMLLCLETVSCVVCKVDDKTAFELSLAENLSRCDLNMFDVAESLSKLLSKGLMSREQLAEKLSVSPGYIEDKLRLLSFAPHERQLIVFSNLSEKHAIAILRLDDHADRLCAIQAVAENKLSASQTESYVKAVLQSKAESPCGEIKQVKALLKDTRIFVNTLEKSVSVLKQSGIPVSYEKTQPSPGELEFMIHIAQNA